MPLYSYECQQCQTTFEIRATFKEKEVSLESECPKCHYKDTKQLFTAGLLIRSGNNIDQPRQTCSPNTGPGCCR